MSWPNKGDMMALCHAPVHIGVDHAAFLGGPSYMWNASVATRDLSHGVDAVHVSCMHAIALALRRAIEAGFLPETVNVERLRELIAELEAEPLGQKSCYSLKDAGCEHRANPGCEDR
jgi:hypothetical protein